MSNDMPAGNRRKFLGWAGRVGIAAVGAIAGATAVQQPAEAYYRWYCCKLAHPQGSCPGSGAGFYCTQGRRLVWECCRSDGRVVFCGECAGGPTCHDGPWYCSEAWVSQNYCF